MAGENAKPRFFAKPADFRKWLKANHEKQSELWVGFYKVGSGKPSITWPQAVDQALCYGWIDGVRKSIDAESYMIRFTPRRKSSIWSQVNLNRVPQLIDEGLMEPAGLKAYEARDEKKTNRYAFEREHVAFDAAQTQMFKKNKRAWTFFEAQPPSYRKVMTWWVVSAKRPETRDRRMAALIAESAKGVRFETMSSTKKNTE